MTVYAPASEAVVLFAGHESDRLRLQGFFQRILGAVSVLAGAGFLLALYLGRFSFGVFDIQTRGGGTTAPAFDPLLAFLMGGCLILVVLGGAWYRAR